MMLTRRLSLGLIPAAALIASPARAWAAPRQPMVPSGGRLAFAVWRNGSKIGTHTVAFTQSGDAVSVQTQAHFSVGLGPVNLFDYKYQVAETWRGGVLDSLTAQTNDNGTHGTCTAHRRGNQMQVNGSKSGSYTAPKGSIAGTHWNKAELEAPMINPENGVLMKFSVADSGDSTPPGGSASAHHFALTGFATIDLWYDASNTWVGLKAVAKDKSIVEYRAA